MIAAACAGGITSAMSGTATMPKPPANPPFAIPYSRTAGTAAR